MMPRLSTSKRKLFLYVLAPLGLTTLGLLAFPFYLDIPEKLQHKLADRSIYARDGSWLASVPFDDHYRQEPLPENQALPEKVVRALLVSEDKRFFSHLGIDPLALARAIRDNLSAGRIRSGASTLSMQLAKMMRPPSERSIWAKIGETLLARRIEMSYSKEDLLRAYLNHADFGQLSRGIETAARYYFSKRAAQLQLHEAALLIAQLRSPTYYSPWKHPERALQARNRILHRLGEAELAKLPLSLRPPQSHAPAHLRHRPAILTLDPILQEHAEKVVKEEISLLKKRNVRQAAVVVIDNQTGEVLASIASANRADPTGGQLDGTTTPRSAGSTLKPFVYLLALRAGKHPASIYPDLPTPFPDARGIEAPSNYNDKFLGPISMRVALGSSQNIPALLTLNSHGGVKALLPLLRELGYKIPDENYGLGLAIGNAHVTLMQQATAFCTLARGGLAIPLKLYKDTLAPQALELPKGERLIAADHAYQISQMLSDVNARVAGFGLAGKLRFHFPCAVKTGTSSNFRDNWCIGYTTRYTVAVWTGNFDQSRMDKVSGLTGAAPIFHNIMNFLHEYENAPAFGDPEQLGLVRVEIDPRTGRQAPPAALTRSEWLNEEQRASTAMQSEAYDEQGRVHLPIEYLSWYKAQGQPMRELYSIAQEQTMERRPRIHMPASGTAIFLDADLRHGGSIIPLRSSLHPERAHWRSDTLTIYRKQGVWYARLHTGEHTIEVIDPETGEHASSTIRVR